MQKIKPFYIVVNPVASKFAKELQRTLKTKVNKKILRVHPNNPKTNLRISKYGGFRVTSKTYNKLEQYNRFVEHGISCPKFTTDPNNLRELGSKRIFARTLLNSTSGKGIVEFDLGQPVPVAPVYTEYIPKKSEYRVHVFGDSVIDVQQKKKRAGFEDERNTRVRNVANGYVYCRSGISPPAGINNLACSAVRALGYKYGAVDIVYNERNNRLAVLEVNSRPGLMGTTLDKYAEAVLQYYNPVERVF